MRSIAWVCVIASVGCGTVTHREDTDGGGNPGDFTVEVAPASALLRQGQAVDFEVTVVRGEFAGAIEVTAAGLPDGVSAQPLTIADGADSGTLTLEATGDAVQGVAAVTVSGEAPDGTGSGDLRLLVGGEPGSFDESFADSGIFVDNFGIAVVAQRGFALQPDGKILGTATSGGQAVTYRLLTDGSVDDGFGTAGVVTTGIGEATGGLVPLMLSDGRVVVAGFGGPNAGYDSALFGYTAEGDLDGDFGSSGTVSVSLGAQFDEFHGLVEDADGGLVVAGVELTGPGSTVRRYDGQGNVDDAYTIEAAAAASVESAVLQSDGKTVVGGGMGGDFWLERHLAGGGFDNGFDGDGTVTTDMGAGDDVAIGIALIAGGKLVVGGLSGGHAAAARYNGNGSLDLTFGDSGKAVTEIELGARGSNSVAVDSQGRILIVGFVTTPSRMPAAVRLTSNGDVDDTFGDGGLVTLDIGVGMGSQTGAYGVAIDGDDRVVICSDVGAPGSQQANIVRLWP